jgi:AcrR family transcriptional regulator
LLRSLQRLTQLFQLHPTSQQYQTAVPHGNLFGEVHVTTGIPVFPHEGVRERKKRKTRIAIRQAAMELFSERGFTATTVDEIAVKANISSRTFFNYFASKEQCVVFPHDELSTSLRMALVSRPRSEQPIDSFREAVKELFKTLEAVELVRAQIIRGALLQRSEPVLQAADGMFRRVWEDTATEVFLDRGLDRMTARVCAVAGVGVWKASMQEWAAEGARGSMVEAIHNGFEALRSNGTMPAELEPVGAVV